MLFECLRVLHVRFFVSCGKLIFFRNLTGWCHCWYFPFVGCSEQVIYYEHNIAKLKINQHKREKIGLKIMYSGKGKIFCFAYNYI